VSLIKALDVAAQENTAGAMNLYYSYEMGFSNIDDVMMELVPKEILLYDKVLSYSGEIFAGLNLILLIFVTRFTSKNELTVYKELNEAKRVKTKRFLIPVLIGIAFSIGIYFGFPILLGIFTDLLV
ncbi:hypothetical protein HON58_02780, partial [Candidatus Peregrinibacteria bacterium]|nr:hypothetical protein [Candidatus Peregrinibacteria bacterium]